MDKDYIIFQENGLYGAKDLSGSVVIEPQYKEMNPFSCGLSFVKNQRGVCAFIDVWNKTIIHLWQYDQWDETFICGFIRVSKNGKWGIIDTHGTTILLPQYESISPIKANSLDKIEAIKAGVIRSYDLSLLAYGVENKGSRRIIEYEIREKLPLDNPRIRRSLHPNTLTPNHKKTLPIYTYSDNDDEEWDDNEANNGWNRDDIESGLADAFEDDYENYISR